MLSSGTNQWGKSNPDLIAKTKKWTFHTKCTAEINKYNQTAGCIQNQTEWLNSLERQLGRFSEGGADPAFCSSIDAVKVSKYRALGDRTHHEWNKDESHVWVCTSRTLSGPQFCTVSAISHANSYGLRRLNPSQTSLSGTDRQIVEFFNQKRAPIQWCVEHLPYRFILA